MLSCSIWFSAPSFWMGGGLESRCVGRVYGADGAVRFVKDTVFVPPLLPNHQISASVSPLLWLWSTVIC